MKEQNKRNRTKQECENATGWKRDNEFLIILSIIFLTILTIDIWFIFFPQKHKMTNTHLVTTVKERNQKTFTFHQRKSSIFLLKIILWLIHWFLN